MPSLANAAAHEKRLPRTKKPLDRARQPRGELQYRRLRVRWSAALSSANTSCAVQAHVQHQTVAEAVVVIGLDGQGGQFLTRHPDSLRRVLFKQPGTTKRAEPAA